jgi:hypothetical protein
MADSPIEKIHIDEFLTLVEGLEVYESGRQDPPEPDFWAKTNLGLIGIEHTRLFKKVDQNKVDPVAEEKLGEDVLAKAQAIFDSTYDQKVHVNMTFKSDFGVNRTLHKPLTLKDYNRLELAKQLVEFVSQNVPAFETYVDFENPNPWTDDYILPEVISSVSIGYFPKNMTRSFFGSSAWHFSPTLQNGSSLFNSLEKKNSKPSKYLKEYAQIWLVFVASPFNITMDFNFDRGLPEIQSTFDRVFIYRHGDQKYHELQQITG